MARTREFLRKAGAQISKVLHKRKQRRSKQPRASLVQGTSLMNSPYRFPHNTPTRTFVNSPKTRSSTVHKPAQRLYKSSPLARPSADPPEFYPLSESPVGSRVKQLSTPIRTREGVYDLRAIQQRRARLNPSAAKRSTSSTPKTPVVKIDSAVRNYLLAISSSSFKSPSLKAATKVQPKPMPASPLTPIHTQASPSPSPLSKQPQPLSSTPHRQIHRIKPPQWFNISPVIKILDSCTDREAIRCKQADASVDSSFAAATCNYTSLSFACAGLTTGCEEHDHDEEVAPEEADLTVDYMLRELQAT